MIHFDPKIWKQTFISNKFNSQWKCGRCGIGGLQLGEQIQTKKIAESASLKCTNPHCQNQYKIIGTIKQFASGSEVSSSYYKIDDYRLYPTHFIPEVILFEFPLTLQEEIKIKLVMSFNHFWYDLDACANKIRQVIELIVSDKGGVGDNLDKQIKSIKDLLGHDLTQKMLALKWVGNDGSHAKRPFKRDEILDAYCLLVDTLNQLYPDESEKERRESLVSMINGNRGMKNL